MASSCLWLAIAQGCDQPEEQHETPGVTGIVTRSGDATRVTLPMSPSGLAVSAPASLDAPPALERLALPESVANSLIIDIASLPEGRCLPAARQETRSGCRPERRHIVDRVRRNWPRGVC